MKQLLAAIILTLVAACSSNFAPATQTGGDLNLEEYFLGNTTATGKYYSNSGVLKRSFTVDIVGTWDGTVLTLVEDFIYDDGETDQRIWKITKTSEDRWEGRAGDVIGVAEGLEDGSEFSWTYQVALPWKDRSIKVRFDDRMWKLDEKRVLNQAFVQKFGITLGKVIIEFSK